MNDSTTDPGVRATAESGSSRAALPGEPALVMQPVYARRRYVLALAAALLMLPLPRFFGGAGLQATPAGSGAWVAAHLYRFDTLEAACQYLARVSAEGGAPGQLTGFQREVPGSVHAWQCEFAGIGPDGAFRLRWTTPVVNDAVPARQRG